MSRDPGEEFQHATRYSRAKAGGHYDTRPASPERFKHYPEAPVVQLPPPQLSGGLDVLQATSCRRSRRKFHPGPLTQEQLSTLLWSSAGVTAKVGNFELRAAPSAGGLYPIETYLAIHHARGIDPGVYHYGVLDHVLEQLRAGEVGVQLSSAGINQGVLTDAAAVFLWSAVVDRCRAKYRERAWRYIYLDAGHVAAHVTLVAEALGLSSCPVGAFHDDEVAHLLDVDLDSEPPLYLAAVGPKTK